MYNDKLYFNNFKFYVKYNINNYLLLNRQNTLTIIYNKNNINIDELIISNYFTINGKKLCLTYSDDKFIFKLENFFLNHHWMESLHITIII